MDRQQVVVAVQTLQDRWRELLADTEKKRAMASAGELELQKLISTNGPFPFDAVLQHLRNRGIVPPPKADELLELRWSSIGTATNFLDRQNESLNSGEKFLGSPSMLAKILVQPLDYAPEVIAAHLTHSPILEGLSSNRPLVEALGEVRTDAIIKYSLLWDEFQFSTHCAITAAAEAGFQWPEMTRREELTTLNPEYAQLLLQLERAQNDYLQRILLALRPYYPEASF